MAKAIYSAFFLLIFIMFTVFVMSYEYIGFADNDNETSSDNTTRNSMTKAINMGDARVNEEITINEDIAVEAVVREYAQTSDFNDGTRYLNIFKTSSKPAMLAVEAYNKVETPFNSMANRFSEEENSNETITRSREIVIFEAKNLNK